MISIQGVVDRAIEVTKHVPPKMDSDIFINVIKFYYLFGYYYERALEMKFTGNKYKFDEKLTQENADKYSNSLKRDFLADHRQMARNAYIDGYCDNIGSVLVEDPTYEDHDKFHPLNQALISKADAVFMEKLK